MGGESGKEVLINELRLGLNTLSAHGFGYFFAPSTLLEKLFWIVATFVMIGFSISWANNVIVYWKENPTVLQTESTSYPTQNIQGRPNLKLNIDSTFTIIVCLL